jgi:lysylphosphatidylglycerol synthetase-like protein (DUF2156 family)
MTDTPTRPARANGVSTIGASSRSLRRYRRLVLELIGYRVHFGWKIIFVAGLFLFILSFSTRSIHASDIAAIMHTRAQEQSGITEGFYKDAVSILQGHGFLFPDNTASGDTSLLVHAPGYSIFEAGAFSAFGGSYYSLQLIQNLLNSISPILIFLIAARLLGSPVGVVAGLLAAVSHHLSYFSNLILPDSLCALPILAAVYALVLSRRRWEKGGYAVAGVFLGISIWLRPNSMLMGAFIAMVLVVLSSTARRSLRRVWILAIVPLVMIAPITLRNWIIYRQFVLITANTGIVLWEGIADYSGERFGAVNDDIEVAKQEAEWYGEPSYAWSWSYPDGITRDRDRIRRSLGVIVRNPVWFSGAMIRRAGSMLKYSAGAPLILRHPDRNFGEAGELTRSRVSALLRPGDDAIASDRAVARLGDKFAFARVSLRAAERVAKESAQLCILLGVLIVLPAAFRRGLFLLAVPLYYLLFQSVMHTEFRYTLPMHYFLFVFAAVTWVVVGRLATMGIKTLAASGQGHRAGDQSR